MEDGQSDHGKLGKADRLQSRFSKGLTIITQLKPDLSSPGRVVIHSRCHASAFGIDEDPVVSGLHFSAMLFIRCVVPDLFYQQLTL